MVVQDGRELCHWYRDHDDAGLLWKPERCFAGRVLDLDVIILHPQPKVEAVDE